MVEVLSVRGRRFCEKLGIDINNIDNDEFIRIMRERGARNNVENITKTIMRNMQIRLIQQRNSIRQNTAKKYLRGRKHMHSKMFYVNVDAQ